MLQKVGLGARQALQDLPEVFGVPLDLHNPDCNCSRPCAGCHSYAAHIGGLAEGLCQSVEDQGYHIHPSLHWC